MKYILIALLLYIAYQFIVNLVIPVFRTTRTIRKGFREMQDRMQSFNNTGMQERDTPQPSSCQPASKATPGDFIDFEEIK